MNQFRERLKAIIDKEANGCSHSVLIESEKLDNGSIFGKCLNCGEDGFPIRDVDYEQFIEEEDKILADLKREYEALPEIEKLTRRVKTLEQVNIFWEKRARKLLFWSKHKLDTVLENLLNALDNSNKDSVVDKAIQEAKSELARYKAVTK